MESKTFQMDFMLSVEFGKLCFSFHHWRGTNFVKHKGNSKFQTECRLAVVML